MNDTAKGAAESRPIPRRDTIVRAAGLAATAGAAVFAVLLAVRPIASFDIGYHLAYGDHFLEAGQIVQTNRFMYTKLDPARLAGPDDFGPGCWYDAAGDTYHFINANWLSQVIMSAVHRAGGMSALIVLQAAMVAAIFALMIVTMRRFGVGWHWIAPPLLIAAVAGNSRFNLRPEVFGYLVLVGQWCLLARGRLGWRGACGLIGLQILAVNLHSYFLLGIALTGAVFADALLRWLWARTADDGSGAARLARVKWLALATGGVVLASLCNPWHIRGAIMPIQTMLFMSKHDIAGLTAAPTRVHPWAVIGEFASPFVKGFARTRATTAYIALLVATGAAGVVALLRGRWAWLAVLAGMSWVSVTMRRNIAPAAMILAPLCVIVLADGWAWLRGSVIARRGRGDPDRHAGLLRAGSLAVAAAGLAVAAWWSVGVVTQRFYFSDHRSDRFGAGVLGFSLPVDAADWINAHQPAGAIFCDYDTSSNLLYLTRPRREVPILTNTWAFPPYVMDWMHRLTAAVDRSDFDAAVTEYGIGVVVLRHNISTGRLIKALAADGGWAPVNISMNYVVFVRRQGATRALASDQQIAESTLDLEAFMERVGAQDPIRAFALFNGSWLLHQIGWSDAAIRLCQRCLELEPQYEQAMGLLGRLLLGRGAAKMGRMSDLAYRNRPDEADRLSREAAADFQQAIRVLRRARKLNPQSDFYRKVLSLAREQLDALRRRRGPAPAPGRRGQGRPPRLP